MKTLNRKIYTVHDEILFLINKQKVTIIILVTCKQNTGERPQVILDFQKSLIKRVF